MSKLEELIQELCPNGVEHKMLQEVCRFQNGFSFKSTLFKDEGEPILRITNIKEGKLSDDSYVYFDLEDYNENLNAYKVKKGDVVVAMSGATTGKIGYNYSNKEYYLNQRVGLFVPNENVLLKRFLYHWLTMQTKEIYNISSGSGTQPNLSSIKMMKMVIPVPPLEVQCEIVRILDKFTLLTAELTAELTARRKQYEYYFIKILNENSYKKIKLGDIGQVKMCKRILKVQTNNKCGIPFYKIGTFGKEADTFIDNETFEEYKSKYSYPRKGDVLISCSGTIGRTVIFDGKPAYFQDSNIVWLEHDSSKVLNDYLFYYYKTTPWVIPTGGTIARLYNDNILKTEISIPTIEKQKEIVSKLKYFDKLCNDITSGLPAEIELNNKRYEYYRDKLLTFKEKK